MKKKTETYEAPLCAETVDTVSEKIRVFLSGCRIQKRDVLRYAMTAEEILLKTAENGGENKPVRLETGMRYFRPFISLEIEGVPCNVYAEQEDEQGYLGGGILRNLGLFPEYSFTHEKNRYFFSIRKKNSNPFIPLIIALCAAGATGALGLLLESGIRTAVTEFVLTPLNDMFLNVLGCIAGPMIFLSVAWGIYGIGDAATLKRIGKKLILSYTGAIAAAVVIGGLIAVPQFNLNFSGGTGGGNEIATVFSMILGIIPGDIFSPFVEGNTLQIIFLAVLFGIAMLFLGRKTDFIAKTVEQINFIVQFLIEAISRLVPYFIYIVLVRMFWSNTFDTLSELTRLLVVFLILTVLNIAAVVLISSAKNRVSPALLVKKGLPTFIIGVTTASSAAAFGTNMKACRSEYGIDEKISSFGLPLGMVTFKPTSAIIYMVTALFFAAQYRLEISWAWIAVMMITTAILAVATPPIPGGAMTAYLVMFAQLGIPSEALAVALACDSVLDFLITGTDQFLMPFVLLNQAGRLGMVDRDVLLKRKK